MQATTLRSQLSTIRYGAVDTVFYEFIPLDGELFPVPDAGAHIDVHLPSGLIRQYSLITPLTHAKSYVIAVKLDENSRGGSHWMHEKARVGMHFNLGLPRNNFPLRAGNEAVTLIAGGIGITPIYSLLHALERDSREVHLHYWCRTPLHGLFQKEFSMRRNVTMHYSEDTSHDTVSALVNTLPETSEIYCCGPQRMLDDLLQTRQSAVYIEKFGAVEVIPNEDAFTVFLAKSGIEVQVGAGESILEVLKETAADIMYSCEQGVCGACEVKVLEGEPIHRDAVRSEAEHIRNKTMMICCSGCRSNRLVLDV